MQRLTCFLSGRVQGVGMRYAIHDLARLYPIGGLVENLDDGRVRIVVEGPLEVLDAFLKRLMEIAPGHIQKLDRFQSEATGEFRQFVIRR
jgi:acylphosphatase